jgi:CopG family nickel-responsive transcriptional regulator
MTVRFGVSLDESLLERFDDLIDQMGYENRSEAVRDLIREKLVEEEWQAPHKETFGAAFVVYDHHTMSVLNRLNDLQHEHVENVISTMHVHIDEHNCLEVVLLRGPGDEVRKMGQRMCSLKGVKYGKLNLGTTGRKLK